MLAALFAFFLRSTASPDWLWGANLFTLIGALCFLVASYLLIPELLGADAVPGVSAAAGQGKPL